MSDQLVELESLVPQLAPAVERRQIGESLGKVTDKLRDSSRHIARLQAVLEIAQETGFSGEKAQAAVLDEFLDETVALADDLTQAQTADDLRDVAEGYDDFVKRLNGLDRQLRMHWRQLAGQEFKPLIAIGKLLGQLDVATNLGQRLVECGQEAVNIADGVPAEALRDAIIQVRDKRRQLEKERVAFTGDTEVEEFLIALAEGRATLRLVTVRVRSWLEENDALDSFDIRPTG